MFPIHIPRKDLSRCQSTLNNFVWSGKFHRISFKIMRQSIKKGGIGIPDLIYYYYYSSNLVNVTRLLDSTTSPIWASLEQMDLPVYNLAESIWQDKNKRHKNILNNQYLQITLKI